MDRLIILGVSGLLGIISSSIYVGIKINKFRQSLAFSATNIEIAENKLNEFISQIDYEELQTTKSGQELLSLLSPQEKNSLPNKKNASQEAEIEQLRYQYKTVLEQEKTTADIQQNTIRQQIALQELKIQKMRDELQQKQDTWRQKQAKWIRSVDAINSVLKSPYSHSQEMENTINEIINELKYISGSELEIDISGGKSNAKNSNEKLDALTETLFNLLEHRKPNE